MLSLSNMPPAGEDGPPVSSPTTPTSPCGPADYDDITLWPSETMPRPIPAVGPQPLNLLSPPTAALSKDLPGTPESATTLMPAELPPSLGIDEERPELSSQERARLAEDFDAWRQAAMTAEDNLAPSRLSSSRSGASNWTGVRGARG